MFGEGEKPPPGIGEKVAPASSGDSIVLGDMNTAAHAETDQHSGKHLHCHSILPSPHNCIAGLVATSIACKRAAVYCLLLNPPHPQTHSCRSGTRNTFHSVRRPLCLGVGSALEGDMRLGVRPGERPGVRPGVMPPSMS